MLKKEYGTVHHNRIMKAVMEYREVELTLTGVKIVPHMGGGKFSWLIAATLDHSVPEQIRDFLGLEYNEDYNPHITLLEKVVGEYC